MWSDKTGPLSQEETKNALERLAEAATARENEIQAHSGAAVYSSSDEDNDSTNPIFDSFYISSPSAIVQMTNFSAVEFQNI